MIGATLKDVKRIVVKVAVRYQALLPMAMAKGNFSRIDHLAREIADLANQGMEIYPCFFWVRLQFGVDRLGLACKTQKQFPANKLPRSSWPGSADAPLMKKIFAEYGQIVAQVLLTRVDSVDQASLH